MKYNLTERQKGLASWLVQEVLAGRLNESFSLSDGTGISGVLGSGGVDHAELRQRLEPGQIEALRQAHLIYVATREEKSGALVIHFRDFTLTGLAFQAVKSNFAEEQPAAIMTLPQMPSEISVPLAKFRVDHPDSSKTGFLMMRFAAAAPYLRAIDVVKKTAAEHGLEIVRADDKQYHGDLLNNVRTYLHGCGFGIAIYDRIQTDEPNANVGLEVGYMMAMGKPILLLKDDTLPTLPADLAGMLYKTFDTHNPDGTIPPRFVKWLKDFGFVV